MAKVKFNQTLTSVKGAAGDYVFTRHGEESYMRRRSPGTGSASSGQVAQRSLTKHLAEIWAQMDLATKGTWAVLQQKLGYQSAYLCFTAVSKVALNTGGTFSVTAPAFALPAPLSTDLQIVAVNTGSAFTIEIVGPAYTGAKVRVYATVGVPAQATTEFKATAFKPICLLDGLEARTPIQDEYEALYGTVAAGGKIGFNLQAVTDTGLAGTIIFREAIVTRLTAEGAEPGEEDALPQAA